MKNLILIFIFIGSFLYGNKTINAQSTKLEHVQNSYVCYVNNKYMGKEQIPVEVDGKTYYGCCQGCVGNLKSNEKVRLAKDPLTGEQVDKALAYIVLNPNGTSEVYYFKNEKNYQKWKQTKR